MSAKSATPPKTRLSDDQNRRIATTLRRIRAGLEAYPDPWKQEPAAIFQPEAFDDHDD